MGSRKGTRSEAVRKGNRMRRNPAARDIRALKKGRFTILAVKKNGGGSPRRGKGVNANPTPIPV
jgi:hypothetical protein